MKNYFFRKILVKLLLTSVFLLVVSFGFYFVFSGEAKAAGSSVQCTVYGGFCRFFSRECEIGERTYTFNCSAGERAYCEAFIGDVCDGTVCGGQQVISETGRCESRCPWWNPSCDALTTTTTTTTLPPPTTTTTTLPPPTTTTTTVPPTTTTTTVPPTTTTTTVPPTTTATTIPPTTTTTTLPPPIITVTTIPPTTTTTTTTLCPWWNLFCREPTTTTTVPPTTTTTVPPTTTTTVPPTTTTTVPPTTTTTLCPWWNPFCDEPTTTTTTTTEPPPPTTTVPPTTTTLPNRPPSSSNVTVTEPDYCTSGPAATVSWNYSDPDGDSQGAYQVQIDNQSSFSSPEIDSSKVQSTSTSYFSGTGILQFDTTYRARVRVWDSRGQVQAIIPVSPNFAMENGDIVNERKSQVIPLYRNLYADAIGDWLDWLRGKISGPQKTTTTTLCPWWYPFCNVPTTITTTEPPVETTTTLPPTTTFPPATTTLLPTTTIPTTTTTTVTTTTTILLLGSGSGWSNQTSCNGPGCAGNQQSWKTPKHAYPQVNFTWLPIVPGANQSVQFSDTSTYFSTPAQGRSWSWLFGDGGSSNRQNPTHIYSAINNYTVNLTARDQDNFSCSASKVVIVKKPVPIWKEIAPKE